MLDFAPSIADDADMAKRQVPKFSDQLREVIADAEADGITRYRIAQETGIDQASLSKFIHGERGLSFASLDALAEFLEIEVVRKPQRKGRQ